MATKTELPYEEHPYVPGSLPSIGRFRGWRKRTWPIRLRFALLMPFDCKWNAWVRDFTAYLEDGHAVVVEKQYPYEDGEFLIIGPECFTKIDDHSVIAFRGEIYTVKPEPKRKKKGK